MSLLSAPPLLWNRSAALNVKDYGALGDNSHDDTVAIQAAVAALNGGTLYFPPGNYVISSAITISSGCTICGAASQSTSIISKTGSSGALILSADRIVVSDIYFQCQASISAVTSSHAAALTYTTGNLAVVERCYFAGWYISVWFQSCGSWIVRDNFFSRAVGYNLKVQNTAAPDSGDQVVSGNYFQMGGSYATTAHIRQESAGGLRIVDNKILNAGIGLDLAVADGVATSILVVEANSFEYQTVSAVRIGLAGPSNTGTFTKVIVASNQITGNTCASPIIDIAPAVANQISSIQISANVISGTSGSTTFIHFANVDDVAVNGNQMLKGTNGVVVDATVTNIYIDPANKFQSINNPVVNSAGASTEVVRAWSGLVVTPAAAATATSSMYVYTTGGTPAMTMRGDNGNALLAGGLRIGGSTTSSTTGTLVITPTNASPAVIVRSGGGTVDLLQFMNQSTTALLFHIDQYGHIVADGNGTPSVAAGAAAGTGPTVSMGTGSSDLAGVVNVTIGSSPSTNALATVTFHDAYANNVRAVILTPLNSATAALSASTYIGAKSNTSFQVNLSSASSQGVALSWQYLVIG